MDSQDPHRSAQLATTQLLTVLIVGVVLIVSVILLLIYAATR